jgi:hypothetical protein
MKESGGYPFVFVNKYSNITIALACLSKNKELSRALDDLHVVSY